MHSLPTLARRKVAIKREIASLPCDHTLDFPHPPQSFRHEVGVVIDVGYGAISVDDRLSVRRVYRIAFSPKQCVRQDVDELEDDIPLRFAPAAAVGEHDVNKSVTKAC